MTIVSKLESPLRPSWKPWISTERFSFETLRKWVKNSNLSKSWTTRVSHLRQSSPRKVGKDSLVKPWEDLDSRETKRSKWEVLVAKIRSTLMTSPELQLKVRVICGEAPHLQIPRKAICWVLDSRNSQPSTVATTKACLFINTTLLIRWVSGPSQSITQQTRLELASHRRRLNSHFQLSIYKLINKSQNCRRKRYQLKAKFSSRSVKT